MKRSRKWAFVAQEARRLAALGLRPATIAKRLRVNRSTVGRWIASGKVRKVSRLKADRLSEMTGQRPQQWAATVRAEYALDATDEQLVTLAESALRTARAPQTPARLRLTAMGRFQAIVKQLALVIRRGETIVPPAPSPTPPEPLAAPPARAARRDPRATLLPEAKTVQ